MKYPRSINWGFMITGLLCIVGQGAFTFRIAWEKTYLTAKNGEQMIGFSLGHGYFGFLFLFPLLTLLWMIIFLASRIGLSLKGQSFFHGKEWALFVTLSILLVLLFIPFDNYILGN